jgi:hypothetical protein
LHSWGKYLQETESIRRLRGDICNVIFPQNYLNNIPPNYNDYEIISQIKNLQNLAEQRANLSQSERAKSFEGFTKVQEIFEIEKGASVSESLNKIEEFYSFTSEMKSFLRVKI